MNGPLSDRTLLALNDAIWERPRTFTLVITVADWGPSATYEASGAGGTKPAMNIIGPKDSPTLAALVDALRAERENRAPGQGGPK